MMFSKPNTEELYFVGKRSNAARNTALKASPQLAFIPRTKIITTFSCSEKQSYIAPKKVARNNEKDSNILAPAFLYMIPEAT